MQTIIKQFANTLVNTPNTVPLIAIIDIENTELAIRAIQALYLGGICAFEIPLRHHHALAQLSLAKATFNDIHLWAGTVTNSDQLNALADIGIDLAIAPGITPRLLETCDKTSVNLLPGITTASDIMLGMEYGLTHFKFFPAQAHGGPHALRAFSGPFQNITFCASGGISPTNMDSYIQLHNVFAVAGSWLAHPDAIEEKNWQKLTQLAAQLCRSSTKN